MPDPTALLAQDAAEALIALGYPLQPEGDDMEAWRIGDFIMSDAEIIAWALSKGITLLTEDGKVLSGRSQ